MLSKKNKQVCRDLSDCYQLHRTVMSMFPNAGGSNPREKLGVLYRYEPQEGVCDELLVQSIEKPDTSHLPSGYLYAGTIPAVSYTDISKALKRIQVGVTLRFKIRANPTKRANSVASYAERKQNRKENNGIRYPIREEQQLIEWLTRKGLQHGFELLSVAFVETGEKRGLISDKKAITISKVKPVTSDAVVEDRQATKHASIKFNNVIFEGYLKVIDLEKFHESIKSGIGTEKSFGFGMLSFAFVK
nr:type I-E CRISPR-associated protein Cas6/Cse3/CasE [Candidatus Sigynarchaeota archaeon]